MTIYSLSQIKDGTGFRPGTRFLLLPPNAPAGIDVQVWAGTDRAPVVQIDTDFEPDEVGMRVYLNDATAEWIEQVWTGDPLVRVDPGAVVGKTITAVADEPGVMRDAYDDAVLVTVRTWTFRDGTTTSVILHDGDLYGPLEPRPTDNESEDDQ